MTNTTDTATKDEGKSLYLLFSVFNPMDDEEGIAQYTGRNMDNVRLPHAPNAQLNDLLDANAFHKISLLNPIDNAPLRAIISSDGEYAFFVDHPRGSSNARIYEYRNEKRPNSFPLNVTRCDFTDKYFNKRETISMLLLLLHARRYQTITVHISTRTDKIYDGDDKSHLGTKCLCEDPYERCRICFTPDRFVKDICSNIDDIVQKYENGDRRIKNFRPEPDTIYTSDSESYMHKIKNIINIEGRRALVDMSYSLECASNSFFPIGSPATIALSSHAYYNGNLDKDGVYRDAPHITFACYVYNVLGLHGITMHHGLVDTIDANPFYVHSGVGLLDGRIWPYLTGSNMLNDDVAHYLQMHEKIGKKNHVFDQFITSKDSKTGEDRVVGVYRICITDSNGLFHILGDKVTASTVDQPSNEQPE